MRLSSLQQRRQDVAPSLREHVVAALEEAAQLGRLVTIELLYDHRHAPRAGRVDAIRVALSHSAVCCRARHGFDCRVGRQRGERRTGEVDYELLLVFCQLSKAAAGTRLYDPRARRMLFLLLALPMQSIREI